MESNSGNRARFGLWARSALVLILVAVAGWIVSGSGTTQSPTQANQLGPRPAAPFGGGQGQNGGSASGAANATPKTTANGVAYGSSYKNDVSPALRDIPIVPITMKGRPKENENLKSMSFHQNRPDTVVQKVLAPFAMPATILSFDGVGFPGVSCNCAPPDTDGEVGATQYVQLVNEGYQVFNKATGASVLGPTALSSIWTGFGGVCQSNGDGDPVVLYDQLAGRWLITQFAGSGVPTDECIAISTSSDATGTYTRYGFHLGTNFFDYPHLSVWPDAYYMSMNVFNAAGTVFLGPQPFAFDRASMLAGHSATFVSPVGPEGSTADPYLPADLDGSTLPQAGAPASFVSFPGGGTYITHHFHADFATPASSTWTTFASPAAAPFTLICPSTSGCVPELGATTSADYLDAIGDRLMFRLAYRNFGGYESVVGNYTVSSGGVAGVRWFELRNVTNGPETVFQESTYQPDTTWRWMGSAAMDRLGDLAVGYSASSSSIFPQIRYSGRLVGDPVNQLSQGEAHLFDGTGAQLQTGNRWGDYSDMTVDPADDCTFWYTQEYYAATASYAWRTRIGNFKFSGCTAATPTPTVTGTPPTATRTSTPTITPTATATVDPCLLQNYTATAGTATIVPGTTDIGNHCDDCQTTVVLPFSYQLYDQSFTSVALESNGKAHFVAGAAAFTNACIPAAGYTYSIFPYWDDLRTDQTGGGIFTSVSGVAPNRIFNIEWRAAYFTGGTSANFELRLYEGQSRFDVVYGTVALGNTSATSGVQKDGTVFTQYFCNASGGAATGSVSYTRPVCGLPTNTPTRTSTGVPPTNTSTATATRTSTLVPTNTFVPTNTVLPTSTVVPGGMLVGHVTWQGISQPNARNTGITATLSLCAGGVGQNYAVSTDASGFFTATTGLPVGTYNYSVKGVLNLSNAGTLALSAGTNQVEMGLMRAGDCDNNNTVSSTDFNILKATFGKSAGQPGYDARGDFNRDAVVNSTDFNFQKGNFGQGGTSLTCP